MQSEIEGDPVGEVVVVAAEPGQIKVATTGGTMSGDTDPALSQPSADELEEIAAGAAAAGWHVMSHAHGTGGAKAAVKAGPGRSSTARCLDEEIDLMAAAGIYLVLTLSTGQGAPR